MQAFRKARRQLQRLQMLLDQRIAAGCLSHRATHTAQHSNVPLVHNRTGIDQALMRSEQTAAQTETAVVCIVDPNGKHNRTTEALKTGNKALITATGLIKEHVKSNGTNLQLPQAIQHIAPHLTRQGPELQILQGRLIEEISFSRLAASDFVVFEQNDVARGGACPLDLLHTIRHPTIELLQRRMQHHQRKRREQRSQQQIPAPDHTAFS